jgi:hypothetical protein
MHTRQVQGREQDVHGYFRAGEASGDTKISYHHMYIELNIKANYLANEGMQLVYNVGWLQKFKDGIELPNRKSHLSASLFGCLHISKTSSFIADFAFIKTSF